jgi:hypothetical protein
MLLRLRVVKANLPNLIRIPPQNMTASQSGGSPKKRSSPMRNISGQLVLKLRQKKLVWLSDSRDRIT